MDLSRTFFSQGDIILVRDAEWIISNVYNMANGHNKLKVVGISELVRGKKSIFITEIDNKIEIIYPV